MYTREVPNLKSYLSLCEYSLSHQFEKARPFSNKPSTDPLYLAIKDRILALVKENLGRIDIASEKAQLGLFYAIYHDFYDVISVYLDFSIDVNKTTSCDIPHGSAAVSPFFCFAAHKYSGRGAENDPLYEKLYQRMLDQGADMNAVFKGFVYDGPGIAGNYMTFCWTLADLRSLPWAMA